MITHEEFQAQWQTLIITFLEEEMQGDSAHDMEHIHRVVRNALHLATSEESNLAVVLPAAWLHDCITVPKDSPLRSQASRMAADKAVQFLEKIHYPAEYLHAIRHAIEAHSFTANIAPETLEARVVQDADRLDAIGALGIARCLMTTGIMRRPLYYPPEPIPTTRQPDDTVSGIDHFFTKLFTLPETMTTPTARAMATKRVAFMRTYLEQLEKEIAGIA